MIKTLLKEIPTLIGITIGIAFFDGVLLYMDKKNCEHIWYKDICLNDGDVEELWSAYKAARGED